MALDSPEPQLLLLLRRDGLMEADGDDLAAELRGRVDGAVAVGQVGFPVLFLDDAAADGGNGRKANSYVLYCPSGPRSRSRLP
jgi:hypothetical protein